MIGRFIVLLLIVAGCSSPSQNDPVVVIDDDTSSANNAADMDGVDFNNGLTGDSGGGCTIGSCPGAQVCNTATGVCVDCVTDAECGANGSCDPTSNKCACNAGYHVCDAACAANDSTDTCGASCDPCPSDPNGTASCDGTSCSLSCTAPLVLDSAATRCVGCIGNIDCMGAAASVCNAGSCVPCTDATGCAHLTATPICDVGTCVECSAADDSGCGGNSCDASGACTTTPKSSVGQCEPCVADSECMAGACVPMQFQGTARGGFCLPLDSGTCDPPLPVSVMRTSLSGMAGTFCTLNEDLTTCEAVADYFAPCADASDCGAAGLDDAMCEAVDFEFARCTYPCDDSAQCPAASLIGCATGNVGMMWCGAF